MQLRTAVSGNPARAHGGDVTFRPRLSARVAPRPRTERPASSSVRMLRRAPQAIDAAGGRDTALTPGSRVLTGLTLVVMGGLLWAAFQGHTWARDLVQAAWPLFILTAGFCTVMIATDRDDVAGRIGIVAGVVVLFAARIGLVPDAVLLTIGPWAFVLVGLAIALSGLGLRARPAVEGTATETEVDPRGTARTYEPRPHPAFVSDTSRRQRARAS